MKASVKSVIDEAAAGIAASELCAGKARAGATEMGAAHMAAHMTAACMCRKTTRVSAAATVNASQSGTACEREYDCRQRCVKKSHFDSPFHGRAELPSCNSDTLPVVDIPAET
jgi:hypothetical protein